MNKRVFAAVNLPPEAKAEAVADLRELEASWRGVIFPRLISEENWHITMGFFGDRNEMEIDLIGEAIREAAAAFARPKIRLERIVFGPTGGREARMVWLEAVSADLEAVKKSLNNNLEKRGIVLAEKERRFSPHITLARFEPTDPGRLPRLDRKIGFDFEARSLDLMESKLSSGGTVYSPIFEIDFKGVK
ncbi:MAG: RNA 2',3'-cyclic phosphodiesterase [Patescibacteria group bacterium]|nr:RNA 2',3'-cyclic phosphodiesterase [Patescibacteria group bacterium]MCL5261755.1 RNA 2',3'-cyclic phosphodiesterase [Patescibacteria group bacterium]